jgi:hypothetical protein
VTFDPHTGGVGRVTSLQAENRPLPRAAVALDYLDVMHDKDGQGVFVGNSMRVGPVPPEADSGAWGRDDEQPLWYVLAPLNLVTMSSWKIRATGLVFAYQDFKEKTWVRIQASSDQGDRWVIPMVSTKDFRRWLTAGQSGFVSMQFTSGDEMLQRSYNWGDWWNFEAVPTRTVGSDSVRYDIRRPSNNKLATTLTAMDSAFREVPNFRWRLSKGYPRYGRMDI